MSSEKGPKYIYAQEYINSITIIITLEAIEKINTKNDNKKLKNAFFRQRCEKTSTNFVMASRF